MFVLWKDKKEEMLVMKKSIKATLLGSAAVLKRVATQILKKQLRSQLLLKQKKRNLSKKQAIQLFLHQLQAV